MSLYCIWYRRECSRYAALDAPIPQESRLARHLESCDQCAKYSQELRSMTHDLFSIVKVPSPSPAYSMPYIEPVWERVGKGAMRQRFGTFVGAGACMAGLICGLVYWQVRNEIDIRSQQDVPAPHWSSLPDSSAPKVAITDTVSDPGLQSTRPHEFSAPTRAYTALRPERLRKSPDGAAGGHSKSMPGPDTDLAEAARQWRESGTLFESQGDAGLASAAYHAAYSVQPTENAAFDVGRTAEESGDIDEALDVYAGLLDAAAVTTRTEKGRKP